METDELVDALGRLFRAECQTEREEDALIARISALSPDPGWMDAAFHHSREAEWLDEAGMPDPVKLARHLRRFKAITL